MPGYPAGDYRTLPTGAQVPLDNLPFHTWENADGSVWCAFHRAGRDYRLRFPQLADFLVSADGRCVEAIPTDATNAETVDHLFHNQVLPLALSRRGVLIFHASAVAIDGVALAFLGESGRGKSTLACSLANQGAGLLTDDGLVIEPSGDGLLALPSQPSTRLWRDSCEALGLDHLPPAPAVSYTDKARLFAGTDLPHCDRPQPLAAALFLGTGDVDRVTLQPMLPAATSMAWLTHSFVLDPQDKPHLAAQFQTIVRLARMGLSYRLDYPRQYHRLPEVHQAIRDHLAAIRPTG